MTSLQKTAKIVGLLFFIGTAAGILSLMTAGSVVNSPDYLIQLSNHHNMVILGTFFELIMGIALAMIPAILFPVFRKTNEALALGAVIFRGVLEAVAYMGIASCWLMLLTFSHKYIAAAASDASNYQLIGSVLFEAANRLANMLDVVFSIGALFIYYLFYRTKLIPSWLSLWGIAGAVLYLTYPILCILSPDIGLLQIPLAVQEMIMAAWLLIKGFSENISQTVKSIDRS